jgi:hypothetical protein
MKFIGIVLEARRMVIVKGDVFREEEDPYKIYRANKKTIEKYRDYIVAHSMEEIDDYKERPSGPVKYDLSTKSAKADAGKKISKP